MRKMWVVVTGLLCIVAQGAHSQSFEQQVQQISQKVSGAALQTRQAMAASHAAAAKGCGEGCGPGAINPAYAPAKPVEWVAIPAGKFRMGTDSDDGGFEDAKPAHEVDIKTFYMSKTAVTVEQYAECVVKEGCTLPGTSNNWCNWGRPDRQFHPVNCVSWDQARAYAKFKGARLPSEAEFEYAATGGGKNQKYPWGNAEATSELAVMNADSTMPVCSKPKGNTAQGLCDMTGNVGQWVQDKYQESYNGAPADGSAYEGWAPRSDRVVRGGHFSNNAAVVMRADRRGYGSPEGSGAFVGFRLAGRIAP